MIHSFLLSAFLTLAAVVHSYPAQYPKVTVHDLTSRSAVQLAPRQEVCPFGDQSTVSFEFHASGANSTHEFVQDALQGLESYFEEPDNCLKEMITINVFDLTIASFIGKGVAKSAVKPIFSQLKEKISSLSMVHGTTLQLCGNGRTSEHTIGITIDTSGDATATEKIQRAWGRGECAGVSGLVTSTLQISIEEAAVTKTNQV
ncbi:unnamed protein product [Clonostachys rosea]|uniref:Ecp2 effector protein domain-containing protein n=1 Tax=Bionectria ochroleuca TaxID=29856 RepID=A0ABY6UJZ6_BIOOC|nr:unnamed protein product [Clonostachys rosea]